MVEKAGEVRGEVRDEGEQEWIEWGNAMTAIVLPLEIGRCLVPVPFGGVVALYGRAVRQSYVDCRSAGIEGSSGTLT